MDNEISITELNECLDDDAEYLMTSEDNDADPGDMDGDFDSAMASAGFGTDEDYNHYEY